MNAADFDSKGLISVSEPGISQHNLSGTHTIVPNITAAYTKPSDILFGNTDSKQTYTHTL